MSELSSHDAARALVRWYAEMGVDEAVGAAPTDWFAAAAATPAAGRNEAAAAKPAARPAAVFTARDAPLPADEAASLAMAAARAATDFETLAAAVAAFEHCPLKAGARSTVFADGVPGADLLVIGEAPGRDEDRIGKPFVGRAGQLLDRMLAAIGRSRQSDTLISNVIFWRPPGNRTPTQVEIAICRPFVERLIELTAPKAVLLAGGAPLAALTGITGIMRARGVWRDIETASGARFPALPMFHPAFLLRQPASKRLAWSDLISLERKLRER
jgi:DNA polymerase